MENVNELDKLLGEKGGENHEATPASTNTGDEVDKKIEAAVAKVTLGFKNRIDSLQTKLDEKEHKIEELERTVQPFKPQAVAPAEDWDTRDGIKSIIEQKANEAVSKSSSDVEKIKESIWDKSMKTLAKSHDIDLDSDEGKAKVTLIRDLAPKIGITNAFDQDDVLQSQEKALAAINYQHLNEQAKIARRIKIESEINSNDLASSSFSESVKQDQGEVEATKADWRAYREYTRTGGTSDIGTFLNLARNIQ